MLRVLAWLAGLAAAELDLYRQVRDELRGRREAQLGCLSNDEIDRLPRS